MSLPDPTSPRKLSRLGLYLPIGLLLVFILAWSGVWVWMSGQTRAGLDTGVARLKAAGVEVAWRQRRIDGYPFRLNITFADLRVREPSGWAVETPKVEAQAFLYAPTHWLFAAPDGLTFVRPESGPVEVKGRVLRASLSHLGDRPPSLSLQGLDVRFRPGPGGQPFGLQDAKKVEFHLRAGPNDEGGVFTTVEGGKATLPGLFGRIAGDKPVGIVWNATLTKMSAFRGATWAQAVRRWSDAGGRMNLRQAGITAGAALITINSGQLDAGPDGRLRGVLDASLKEAPRALGAMGDTGLVEPERAVAASAVASARQGAGDVARATINFEAGQTTLGPAALGPAPKVYEP